MSTQGPISDLLNDPFVCISTSTGALFGGITESLLHQRGQVINAYRGNSVEYLVPCPVYGCVIGAAVCCAYEATRAAYQKSKLNTLAPEVPQMERDSKLKVS